MDRYLKHGAPKLGFGLMRLPKLAEGETDMEQTKIMVDLFMKAGQTYFDTAFVYGKNGESEKATKQALVDRYPRESYTLATKLCAWLKDIDEEAAKKQFTTSLERTGAGYFDYYLLHALQADNYKKYDEYHLWDFMQEMKAKGLIRHAGFSFHSTPELLDEILTAHPETEFVQLQINYADWESPSVRSRGCYEVARKHGKPVVIMEPVKGGTLASPPEKVRDILKEADPAASAASWAIRYAASLEGVLSVLSGMSNVEQMKDNLSYMKEFRPLDEEEQKVIGRAREVLAAIDSIPCTECHYCTAGCPMQIPIPEIFSAMNRKMIWNEDAQARRDYAAETKEKAKASECIACGQCEAACPQQIPVIEKLRACAEALEG